MEPNDIVGEAVLSMTGRMKLARRDGVTAGGCAAVTLEATDRKSLGEVMNEWAEQNPSATIYEIIPHYGFPRSVTLAFSGEITGVHKEVLELYGQEINLKVRELRAKRAAEAEAQLLKEEQEAGEAARLVEVGRSYEKRLIKAKKLKTNRLRTQALQELEAGGAHFEVFFESLKKLMQEEGPQAEALRPLVTQLAKSTGVAKLLEMDTSADE